MLILDNGDVILDSYVIVEYLDELAGGGKLIPPPAPSAGRSRATIPCCRACSIPCCCAVTKHGAAGAAAVEGVVG